MKHCRISALSLDYVSLNHLSHSDLPWRVDNGNAKEQHRKNREEFLFPIHCRVIAELSSGFINVHSKRKHSSRCIATFSFYGESTM
jgi:hypothetical protein